MNKLIATTALALILGGPVVAQDTPDPAKRPEAGQDQAPEAQAEQPEGEGGQTETAQQPEGEDSQTEMAQQPEGTQDQQTAGGIFYQPHDSDVYLSGLMDADVYAPQTRQGGSQDQQAEGGQEQTPEQQQTASTQPQADGMPAGGGQGLQLTQLPEDELAEMAEIGTITDVIVGQQGDIQAVVVEVGGFLGVGAREVAMSSDQLSFGHAQDDPSQLFVVTQVAADELESAPEFQRAESGHEQEQQQAEVVGGDPATMMAETSDAETEAAEVGVVEEADPAQEEVDLAADESMEAEAEAATAMDEGWRSERTVIAAPAIEREGFSAAPASEISVDTLVGTEVYDINDENIGSISDVVLSEGGAAQYAVIDVGGFLGLGARSVALGFDEMQILRSDIDELRAYVDVTEEVLESMPEYEAAEN